MVSILENRTLIVNGRRTSIRLEPQLWAALEAIARRQGRRVNALCSEIDRDRGSVGLTSAVRIRIFGQREPPGPPCRAGPASAETELAWIRRFRTRKQYVETPAGFEAREDIAIEGLPNSPLAPLIELLAFRRERETVGPGRTTFAEIEPLLGMLRPRLSPMSSWNLLDVSAEDPANYRFLRHGSMSAVTAGADMTNRRVVGFPFDFVVPGLLYELHDVKTRPFPKLQIVEQKTSRRYRHYLRLLLPLSDADGLLSTVLSATTPLADSDVMRAPAPLNS